MQKDLDMKTAQLAELKTAFDQVGAGICLFL